MRGLRRGLAWGSVAMLALLGLAVLAAALPLLLARSGPVPTSSFMLLARRADPATGLPCEVVAHRWAPREAIARDLRLAVVLAEDQKFRLHRGFDTRQLEEAWAERQRGERRRGASTISQQLAKNLFLWPSSTWLRKGLEAWFTAWIELLWTKQRILEVYLNVAQFGPCVFGAEAAAERFFATSAADLAPEQAALLAAVLPNPKRLRAHDPGPYARERTAEILALMDELGGAPHLRGL